MTDQFASPRDDEFLDYAGASHFLGGTPTIGTLQVWVCTQRYGIPYYKVGRKVRFKKSELLAWIETRKRGGVTV